MKTVLRAVLGVVALGVLSTGCAKICQFGQSEGSSGVGCVKFISDVELGMTEKEVRERVGVPQNRRLDVAFRGKTYDEVWVYDTSVPTVMYFKNGVLEHKEYEQ